MESGARMSCPINSFLDLPYRRLTGVLHEMPRFRRILDPEIAQLLNLIAFCARMQAVKMPNLRDCLRLFAKLHDTGEI